jgi:hypothetical protein
MIAVLELNEIEVKKKQLESKLNSIWSGATIWLWCPLWDTKSNQCPHLHDDSDNYDVVLMMVVIIVFMWVMILMLMAII